MPPHFIRLAIRACLFSLIVACVAQVAWAGGHSSGGRTVHVNGYYRKDGTYVHAYDRAAPGTASYVPTTSSTTSRTYTPATSNAPSVPVAAVVPVATSDLRSDKQRVQDAIAAGRIVLSGTKSPTDKSANLPTLPVTQSQAAPGVARDEYGKIKRSESAKREFMRTTGYPNGRLGYVVDHIIPLKRGGCDCPSNMQWLTIQEAKAKDKWE